jgi:hypothetical protein
MRLRRERDLAQALLDADAPQYLHRVRHHLNARTDAREAARLLVHPHVEAVAQQDRGDRHPSHARAYDRDRKCLSDHG